MPTVLRNVCRACRSHPASWHVCMQYTPVFPLQFLREHAESGVGTPIFLHSLGRLTNRVHRCILAYSHNSIEGPRLPCHIRPHDHNKTSLFTSTLLCHVLCHMSRHMSHFPLREHVSAASALASGGRRMGGSHGGIYALIILIFIFNTFRPEFRQICCTVLYSTVLRPAPHQF